MIPDSEEHENAVHANGSERFWQWKNVRFRISLLLCFNFLALAFMRNGLGIAMVCMVNSTAIGILEDLEEPFMENDVSVNSNANASFFGNFSKSAQARRVSETAACPITSFVRHEYEGEFVWDTAQQGVLFAALYWGSFTSLPGGWLADRYSPRHVLFASVLLNVVGSVLTPFAAEYGGYAAVFVTRFLMGAGQGLQKPAVTAFTARWIPPHERSTAISLHTAGNQLSNILGMPLNAWFCHLKSILNGWPLIFLTSGAYGVFWCVVWIFFATNSPKNHATISEEERRYIVNSLKTQNLQNRKTAAKHIPWKAILTSLPVWACAICSFVNGLVVSTTSSYIPTYFMEVLHLDLYSNGFYSALPYVFQWITKFLLAAWADYLIKNGRCGATTSSKLFNTIGSFATAGFLFGCSFITCAHTFWAIFCLCMAMAAFAAFTPGYWVSMVSIAPVYSGTVSAVTTTTNQIGSIIAPYLVGLITVHGIRSEWQIVYGTLSVALIVSGVFYAIFGSADIQPWAQAPPGKTHSTSDAPETDCTMLPEECCLNGSGANGKSTLEAKSCPTSPKQRESLPKFKQHFSSHSEPHMKFVAENSRSIMFKSWLKTKRKDFAEA